MDDITKSQLFKDKQKAQQPITITNLRVVQSGMVFMHQNSIVKDVSTMAIPFKYVPPAAPPITSVADVLKTKRQGDMVTVSGLIRWDSEASTPQNSKRPVRDGKLVDSTGTIDISIWSDHISLIKEGDFFEISNCTVKYYYGLKISTTTETIIKPAEKQNITNVNTDATAIKPQICCSEIQNVIIDTNAMCNTKGCKSKITGNTESKVMVRCTACNRAMLVKNCYVDMSTTFQLEKEEKQFNVVANHATLSVYLNEDIFQYRNNIDELTEKLLLLENVDFTLSKNGKFITEIVNHQLQPPTQEKSKNE